MKRFVYCYPHCLPEEVQQMSKEEFLGENPQRSIQIWSVEGVETIPVPEDLVICDVCNADIEVDVFLVAESRVYCKLCATKYVLPHCTDELVTRGAVR